MAKMTEERRGEIALKLIETRIMDEGMLSPRRLGDELHTLSQKTGIDVEELKRFYQTFFPRLYGQMFGFTDVRIEASN